MLKVIINNKNYYFNEQMTILQACEKINIHIPKFCYHDRLSIAGNCRMCLIELEKSPKPIASCAMPLNNNMKIFTNSPLVKKARENVLESLLINHPLDCPICDQGGECDLQDQTLYFGSDRTRFFENKRGVEDKQLGPVIKTIMTRCIHCTKCIRFCNEILGEEFLGTLGRTSKTEIGTYVNKFVNNELSGNLVDLCPVGALTSKPYAFLMRSWELNNNEAIDFNDAMGCEIKVYTRNKIKPKTLTKKNYFNVNEDDILRILPKFNKNFDEIWISDKTRFFYDSNNLNRNSEPFMKKDILKKIDWYNALKSIKYILNKNEKNNLSIFGNSLDINHCYSFFKFSKLIGIKNFYFRNNIFKHNINNPLYYSFNNDFNSLSKNKLFILLNTNLRFESSILNLKLRKFQYLNNIIVYQLGHCLKNFYNVSQIGNTILDIFKFIEGKLLYNKCIKSNSHLNILYSEFFFNSFIHNFEKKELIKRFLICNFKDLNVVYADTTSITLNELGITNYAHNTLKKNFKNIFSLKNIEKDLNNLENIKSIIDFNTHKNILQSKYKDIVSLPVSTFYEQNSFFCNMQGNIKLSKKNLSNHKLSKNFVHILKIIINNLNNNMLTSNIISKKKLLLDIPKLNISLNKDINFFYKKKCKVLYKVRIKDILLKNYIKDFFKTNIYNNNSLLLADIIMFLKKKHIYSDFI